MTKKEKDEQLAAHLPAVLQYHDRMLADGVRNRLLYRAIRENVGASTHFLDIGAGTGVWAILAAKLGAKRVVAVEVEECLIPLIYRHAQENNVADRIEIVHAHSNDLRVPGKFDVIVSELFGQDAIGSATLNAFISIRDRFLSSGGVLIPQKLTLMAAPVHFASESPRLPASLPLTTEFLKRTKLNYGQSLTMPQRKTLKFLADAKPLVEIDLRQVKRAPSLKDLTVSWNISDLRRANAIVTFIRSSFTGKIELDALKSKSWSVTVNEFEPFAPRSGKLKFSVTLDENKTNWSIELPSHPKVVPQTYAPVFAFTSIKMAQRTTPHKAFRPATDRRR